MNSSEEGRGIARVAGLRSLVWVNHYAVTPDLPGGTRHVELGAELTRVGWSVTVLSADFHFQERRYVRRSGDRDLRPIAEDVNGVRFVWLWSSPYQTNDWRRAANWISFGRQVRRLDIEADLVIGSSPHLLAAWGGWRLARRIGAPFVLEVRDLWPESLVAAGGRLGPTYFILGRIAQTLYRRAERIIVLTGGVRDALVARGVDPTRIVVAPNGVDPDAFSNTQRPARDTVTFVYAGAHGPANGLDVLLEAAERLREHLGIRILCVGDGPEKARLTAEVQRRGLGMIEMRPATSKAGIPTLLAEADVGLMLLRDADLFAFGVSPNKLFDYLAAGLPVISTVRGEVAAMIEAAGAGETVPPASPGELADAMVRMARRSHAERTAMGAAGRAWVLEHHTRPVVAARLSDALRELVRSP